MKTPSIENKKKKLRELRFEKDCSLYLECALLKTRLLNLGGRVVELQYQQRQKYYQRLIDCGKIYNEKLLHIKGEPEECHYNCSKLANKDNSLKIVTGFALDNYRWILHSWLYKEDNIIETTEVMNGYLGYELTDSEQLTFIKGHLADYKKRKGA